MHKSETPHQGKILELLILTNGKQKKEAAKEMGFHPAHISSQFKEPVISEEIKEAAAKLFKIDVSVFTTGIEGLPSPMVKSTDPNARLLPEQKEALQTKIAEQEETIAGLQKAVLQLTEMLYQQGKASKEELDAAQRIYRVRQD